MKGNNIKNISSLFSLFLLISYISGFIAWNYYLSRFSFFEYNLLQTRYISAGILFWFLVFIIYIILFLIKKSLIWCTFKIRKDFSFFQRISFACVIIIFYFLIFLPYIFQITPSYLGGARPIPITLIANPEQIKFLSNFNIPIAKNAAGKQSVQTLQLCNIYQNKDYIILGVVDLKDIIYVKRVIILRQDQILGYDTILPIGFYYRSAELIYCGAFISNNLKKINITNSK